VAAIIAIAIIATASFSITSCDDGGGGTANTFRVTVNGGSGSGNYAPGATVNITATVPSGQQFANWTVSSGGATLASANSASTSFTMPANPVTVTANFTNASGLSLDGMWYIEDSAINANGATAVVAKISSRGAWPDAVNKNLIHVGDPIWRYLSPSGNLRWTGQIWILRTSYSSAVRMEWVDCVFVLSANGQTLQCIFEGTTLTCTRTTTYSLDGVWKLGSSGIITVNGNNGALTSFTNQNAGWMDAYNKGYLNQWWRNLQSAGSLTWTGQQVWPQADYNNPNVCVGVSWPNVTLVMSENGNTLTVSEKNANGVGDKWTQTYTR
jgi:hypothetical protein